MLIFTSIAAIFFGLGSNTYTEFSAHSNGKSEFNLVYASPCVTGKKESGYAIAPNKVVLFKDISDSKDIEKIAPWVAAHSIMDDKPTFYVCENFTCKRPTTNIKTVLNYINE